MIMMFPIECWYTLSKPALFVTLMKTRFDDCHTRLILHALDHSVTVNNTTFHKSTTTTLTNNHTLEKMNLYIHGYSLASFVNGTGSVYNCSHSWLCAEN